MKSSTESMAGSASHAKPTPTTSCSAPGPPATTAEDVSTWAASLELFVRALRGQQPPTLCCLRYKGEHGVPQSRSSFSAGQPGEHPSGRQAGRGKQTRSAAR